MSENPAAPLARAIPVRPVLPWWLPGIVVGTLAAVVTFAIVKANTPVRLTHTADAFVQVPDEPSAKRQERILHLRSRDLLARVVAEPAVAELPSIKRAADPVAYIADRLTVAEAAPDVLAVTMTSNEPDDVKVILDHLGKRFVDETTASGRKDRDDRMKKLEQLSETLRIEIESVEKQIELMGRAHGTTGGEDTATRLALLQRRYIEADSEFVRAGREVGKLEAEITVLKRQAEKKDGAPADPGTPARIAQLTTAVEVKKEEREKLRTERDAIQKVINNGVSSTLNIDAMRQAMNPQREQVNKVNAKLAELRFERQMDARLAMRGEVTVARVPVPDNRAKTVGYTVGAFAGGFVLATGFLFTSVLS